MVICILGIVLLISKGSWEVLLSFKFSSGDAWILAGAFAFAVYNILVRKKPVTISALSFLLVIFVLGALMLFPFFILEQSIVKAPTNWSPTYLALSFTWVLELPFWHSGVGIWPFQSWVQAEPFYLAI